MALVINNHYPEKYALDERAAVAGHSALAALFGPVVVAG